MPKRVYEVLSPSVSGDPFIFWRMTYTESMSRPYEMTVDLLSLNTNITATSILGESLTVKMHLPDEASRHFHGLVSQFWNLGRRGTHAYYRAHVRPALWFLSKAADCRIFQNKKPVDIITQDVCPRISDIQFSLLATGAHPQREYCVQYRESDLDFVHRLLEEEGIYYFIKHHESSHEVVLCDGSGQHQPIAGGPNIKFRGPGEAAVGLEHISRWIVRGEVETGAQVLDDYDFTAPRSELRLRSARARQHKQDSLEVYDYPGRYKLTSEGDPFIKARLEEEQWKHLVYEGLGDHTGLAVGGLFTLEEHPRQGDNRQYLLVETTMEVESNEIEQFGTGEDRFDVRFKAIPSDEQFRPPRVTPKGSVKGPHTAKVVGPQGEEIWTDEYGRVKVKFHWDRREEEDENSSCWIRVAQVWAGQNWGAMNIPRIGQEVIVDFLEGDPDRPIITGRVYNADNMPPHKLPDKQNYGVIMSRSTPDGTADNFNELRFDDTKDAELVYFHAEKDFSRYVENNDTLKIGFDKKDKGDQTIDIFNNQTVNIGTSEAADGSQTFTIWNNRTSTIKNGNDRVTIEKGNQTIGVSKGNQEITVDQGNHTLTVSTGTSDVEAGTHIMLKVGSSSIKIEAAKITIQSPEIALTADGKISISAPLSDVSGSGSLKLSGAIVKIN